MDIQNDNINNNNNNNNKNNNNQNEIEFVVEKINKITEWTDGSKYRWKN